MIKYLKSTTSVFLRYRYLLANLVSRDVKVKYRRSFLGIAWSVLNPLLMSCVMALVFQGIFKLGDIASVPTVSATGQTPNFLVYVLSGQLLFAFFSEATTTAMDSVYANSGLIKKVYIPKYIFPLEKVMFSLLNTLFSMISLIIVILATLNSGSALTFWMLLFPLPLLLLFFFNLGVGLILSAGVVFFRDIKHLYSVLVLALTYMTPIFYTEAIFANSPFMNTVIRLNPIYWFVSMFRQLMVYGRAPTLPQLLVTSLSSLVVLILGLIMFRRAQDDFILYI